MFFVAATSSISRHRSRSSNAVRWARRGSFLEVVVDMQAKSKAERMQGLEGWREPTPKLSHLDRIQRQSAIGIGFGKLEHTLGGGIFFGTAIGQLGQRLGRRDTNRYGDASPLLDTLSNGSAQRLNVQVLQWSKVEKHLIDGINFNVWDKFQNGTHHPPGISSYSV